VVSEGDPPGPEEGPAALATVPVGHSGSHHEGKSRERGAKVCVEVYGQDPGAD